MRFKFYATITRKSELGWNPNDSVQRPRVSRYGLKSFLCILFNSPGGPTGDVRCLLTQSDSGCCQIPSPLGRPAKMCGPILLPYLCPIKRKTVFLLWISTLHAVRRIVPIWPQKIFIYFVLCSTSWLKKVNTAEVVEACLNHFLPKKLFFYSRMNIFEQCCKELYKSNGLYIIYWKFRFLLTLCFSFGCSFISRWVGGSNKRKQCYKLGIGLRVLGSIAILNHRNPWSSQYTRDRGKLVLEAFSCWALLTYKFSFNMLCTISNYDNFPDKPYPDYVILALLTKVMHRNSAPSPLHLPFLDTHF